MESYYSVEEGNRAANTERIIRLVVFEGGSTSSIWDYFANFAFTLSQTKQTGAFL